MDYHGNRVGNFNIMEAHSELIVETNMLVRTTHSKNTRNRQCESIRLSNFKQ
jgi:hypothetical protein